MNRTDDLDELITTAVDDQMRVRAPADLFDRVRDATQNHSQRSPWLARATGHHLTSPSTRPVTLRHKGERPVYGTYRLVAAVVAVAIVGVVGFALLARRDDSSVAAPPASPTTSASASPVSTPAATPMLLAGGPQLLVPGTYVTGAGFDFDVTLTVPDGWTGHVPGPNLLSLERDNAPGGVFFQQFDRVAVDPCDPAEGFLNPAPGPAVDDLVAALVNMPNIDATSPIDASVGGYRGEHLTLTAPDSFSDCDLETADEYLIWQLPLGATMTMTPSQRTDVWVLDVEGERLVIDVPMFANTTQEQRAETQAILDSIRLGPGD